MLHVPLNKRPDEGLHVAFTLQNSFKTSGSPTAQVLPFALHLVKTLGDSLEYSTCVTLKHRGRNGGILLHLLLSFTIAYPAYTEINSFCEALFPCYSDCLNAFLFPCRAVHF